MGSAQHGDLMPQHEELGVLGGRRTTKQDQPATDPDEDQIEEAEGHGRSSWPTEDPAASLQFTGQADLWHPIGHPGKATGQARRSRAAIAFEGTGCAENKSSADLPARSCIRARQDPGTLTE